MVEYRVDTHERLVERVKEMLTESGYTYEDYVQSEKKPDIVVHDESCLGSEQFESVWFDIQATLSGIAEDAVEKFARAVESDARMVFAFPIHEGSPLDKYPQQVSKILSRPALCSGTGNGHTVRPYTAHEALRTTDGEGVVVEKIDKEHGIWRYDKETEKLYFEYDTIQIEISEINSTMPSVSSDNITTVEEMTDAGRYTRVPQPLAPFHLSKSKLEKTLMSTSYLSINPDTAYLKNHPHAREVSSESL